jgi:hypothetical protein
MLIELFFNPIHLEFNGITTSRINNTELQIRDHPKYRHGSYDFGSPMA